MVFTKEIRNILEKAMHPELNRSLIDLAMIRKVTIKDSKVTVTLVVPFLHVPIRDDLIKIIKDIIKKNKDMEAEVIVKEMNENEKKIFGTMVKKIRGRNLIS